MIGKTLVHETSAGVISGRIVETEAYVTGDAAGHAYRGLSRRNQSLFLKRGHAYICFVYGAAHLLNVSSDEAGVGAGVLIRALEPLEGIELMESVRGTSRPLDLARGPGRLFSAMWLDESQDGFDLCTGKTLWLGEAVREVGPIGVSTRIGITKDADRLLRFYEKSNKFVSGPRKLNS